MYSTVQRVTFIGFKSKFSKESLEVLILYFPQVCIDGNEEIAQILLRHGPSINAPDNDGWTPLHAAAQCGFTDLARYVII